MGLLAVIGLALAFVAARDAAVAAFRTFNPGVALLIDRSDGKALAKVSLARLAATKLTRPLPQGDRQALVASLEDNPLNAAVLRTLAIDSDIRQDRRRAQWLMQASSRVTRRDLGTQVWLVNDAVRRQDLHGVMFHFDAALSTDSDSYEFLFPNMIKVLPFPQFRAELVPLVRARRPWVPSFIGYAISYAPSAVPVTTLIEETGKLPNAREMRPMLSSLLGKLVAEGQVQRARKFAVGVLGADPEVLEQAGFSEKTVDQDFAPLTWQLTEGADESAFLDRDGQIEIRASTDRWSPAASRVFTEQPGTYQIEFSSLAPGEGAAASTLWEATCVAEGKKVLLYHKEFASSETPPTWHDQLAIPQKCNGVRIDVSAKSDSVGSDAILTIRDFRLARKTG
jgi:hypothetical protein